MTKCRLKYKNRIIHLFCVSMFIGPLSDVRIASVIFFTFSLGISSSELTKFKQISWKRQYQRIRLVFYASIFVHALFGLLCTLWVTNVMYGPEAFAFLFLTCSANMVYQSIAIWLLLMKLKSLLHAPRKEKLVSRILISILVVKTMLSMTSLIMMFYFVLTQGHEAFYKYGYKNPLARFGSVINLIGNLIFMYVLCVAQYFFVKLSIRHLRIRATVLTTATLKPKKSEHYLREYVLTMLFSISAVLLIVACESGQLPHSVSLSYLSFVTAEVMRIFDKVDKIIVRQLMGTRDESSKSNPTGSRGWKTTLTSQKKLPFSPSISKTVTQDGVSYRKGIPPVPSLPRDATSNRDSVAGTYALEDYMRVAQKSTKDLPKNSDSVSVTFGESMKSQRPFLDTNDQNS